jgi:hypothetical protein
MPAHCAPAVHPAIEKSRELHEQPQDFTYQELFFVRRVGEICVRTVHTEQSAADMFGKGSPAYRASCYLAQRQEASDLTNALSYFMNSVEQRELVTA